MNTLLYLDSHPLFFVAILVIHHEALVNAHLRRGQANTFSGVHHEEHLPGQLCNAAVLQLIIRYLRILGSQRWVWIFQDAEFRPFDDSGIGLLKYREETRRHFGACGWKGGR